MSMEESAYVRPTFTKLPFDKKERILEAGQPGRRCRASD